MSKKRVNDRLKKQPAQSSCEQQTPKKKTEEQLASESRRKFLKIAGGTVVAGSAAFLGWRLGFSKLFEDSVQEEKPKDQTDNTQEAIAQPELTTTPEWIKGIELPTFTLNINTNHAKPTIEQLQNAFCGDYIDRKKLDLFYKIFDRAKEKLLANNHRPDIDIKRKAFQEFYATILSAYRSALKDISLYDKFWLDSLTINNALIPYGYVVVNLGGEDSPEVFGLFEVEDVQSIDSEFKGKSKKIPIVFSRLAFGDKNKLKDILGGYYDPANYIVIDRDSVKTLNERGYERINEICKIESIPRPSALAPDSETALKTAIIHEAMHASLANQFTVVPHKRGGIKRRGQINMGSYKLESRHYEHYDNQNLHELVAHGCGFMMSGQQSLISAWELLASQPGMPDYELAAKILLKEIVYSNYISKSLKSKIFDYIRDNGKVSNKLCMEALLEIPDGEFYRIGERMAKLAIYLTQK